MVSQGAERPGAMDLVMCTAAGAHHPSVALANWMPSRMPMSSQFWMAAWTMTAIQIMMGMGWISCSSKWSTGFK